MSNLLDLFRGVPEEVLVKMVDAMPDRDREQLLLLASQFQEAATREASQKNFLNFVKHSRIRNLRAHCSGLSCLSHPITSSNWLIGLMTSNTTSLATRT